jgi:hypothetical protein
MKTNSPCAISQSTSASAAGLSATYTLLTFFIEIMGGSVTVWGCPDR